METESTWSVDRLRDYLMQRMDNLVTLLDERYVSQSKAGDAAFAAQQTAMTTAFDVADKAVRAALAAAKETSEKAEESSDKRFESSSQLRTQLENRLVTLINRVDSIADRVVQLELRLTSRLDLAKGSSTEYRQEAGDRRLDSAALAQWAAMALIGIGVIVSVVLGLVHH